MPIVISPSCILEYHPIEPIMHYPSHFCVGYLLLASQTKYPISVAFSQFFCSQDPDYRKMAVVNAHARQTSVALTPNSVNSCWDVGWHRSTNTPPGGHSLYMHYAVPLVCQDQGCDFYCLDDFGVHQEKRVPKQYPWPRVLISMSSNSSSMWTL